VVIALALMVVAIVAAPALAVRYVRPRGPGQRIAAILLGLGALVFGSWLLGQGDESLPAAILATAGLVLCLVALRRGRQNVAAASPDLR
jgi:ABC-type Mn2+/Zn2+ transport system permease subunit